MKLAYQKLEKLQAWNEAQKTRKQLLEQRSEQFKSNVFWFGQWLGSGLSGVFVYLTTAAMAAVASLALGINLPNIIACKNDTGICYQLRLNKSSVVLPHQVEQVLKEYERSKKRNR